MAALVVGGGLAGGEDAVGDGTAGPVALADEDGAWADAEHGRGSFFSAFFFFGFVRSQGFDWSRLRRRLTSNTGLSRPVRR